MAAKGYTFEEQVRQFFFNEGYFAIRSLPLRFVILGRSRPKAIAQTGDPCRDMPAVRPTVQAWNRGTRTTVTAWIPGSRVAALR